MVTVNLEPMQEDSPYVFSILGCNLPTDSWENWFTGEEYNYLRAKDLAFMNADTNPSNFCGFDRPSLRNLEKLNHLPATIYTHAVEIQNGFPLSHLLDNIKEMLENTPKTRRCVLRLANPLIDYYDSTKKPVDVSCLAFIHFTHAGARLVFRASDVKNELIPDILTINKHFLKPVYGSLPYNITVFSSTAQNILAWSSIMNELENLVRADEL